MKYSVQTKHRKEIEVRSEKHGACQETPSKKKDEI